MAGVSVIKVGATNGVSTDVDGKYSVSVTKGRSGLILFTRIFKFAITI